MSDKIVPAGIPTIVPIETYGAMKKSPIHIPKSFVISINIFGRKSNGTDCVSVFSSSRSSVYDTSTYTGIVYSIVTFFIGVIISAVTE